LLIKGILINVKNLIFSSKQKDLYDETFSELVESVLNGYNGKK